MCDRKQRNGINAHILHRRLMDRLPG